MTIAADVLDAHPQFATFQPPMAANHEALLDVICGCGPETRRRFQAWLDTVDVKNLDDSFYRLYPFLYERLRDFDPGHPLLAFFQGNSRKTFYTNNLLFHRAAAKIAELRSHGIPVLILKGAALIQSQAYRTGLRPMADIDFLIPTHELGRALEILTPLNFDAESVVTLRDFQHGHTVVDELGFEYDLHWHAMPQCCGQSEKNTTFWEAAESAVLQGSPVLCLNPTDSLLLVCVHGIQWNPFPPIRWIPDTLMLLRQHHDRIDWSRLMWLAGHTETTLLLLVALRYLRARFAAPIPEAVLSALANNEVGRLEETAFPLAFYPWDGNVPWAQAEPLLREQVRLQARRHPGRPLLVILEKETWNPQQSRLCQELGTVPIIKVRKLPNEWMAAVVRHLNEKAKDLIPTLIDHHTRHPATPATHLVELNSPESGSWRIVIQSDPKGVGMPPELRIADVYQSPLDRIPREAIVFDASSYALAHPVPSLLADLRKVLALHNKRITAKAIPPWRGSTGAARPE